MTAHRVQKDLEEYNNNINDYKPSDAFRIAFSKTVSIFTLPNKVNLCHICELSKRSACNIWIEPASLPWEGLGCPVKDDKETLNKIRLFWHRIKNGEDISAPDCFADVCTPSESKNWNNCIVWKHPRTVIFGQAVFALPLIEAYQLVGAYSYDYKTALGGMPQVYNRFRHHKQYTCLKFKKFNQTIPNWLVKYAFSMLGRNINFGNFEGHGIPDASKMFKMFSYVQDNFINTTVQTSNELRFKKNSGILKGCYFSRLVSTICVHVLCQWVCLEQSKQLAQDILVQGEDSLLATEIKIDLNKANDLMKSIGMEIDIAKSKVKSKKPPAMKFRNIK